MNKRKENDILWVPVERITLDIENPRFPENSADNETDAIDLLCKDEQVLGLAKDIVQQNSINSLQLIGVIHDHKPSKGVGDDTYIVVEGNRRLCALKLLIDPDRCPAKFKKNFEALSSGREAITEVPIVIFKNRDESRRWIKRTHAGLQGGIGRKDWDAEQNQRFSGSSKNKRALAILDYAQKSGMISEENRKGKITTVERYLSSELFRDVIGIDDANIDDICRNRPEADFDKRLNQFIQDLVKGEKVNSRVGNSKESRKNYARSLSSSVSVSDERIKPFSLSNSSQGKTPKLPRNNKPRKMPKIRAIQHSAEIKDRITKIQNSKLESLYYSICKIDLDDAYVPLLTIGAWAFIESLSAAAGRDPNTSFQRFYNPQLSSLGLGTNKRRHTPIKEALARLAENGNTTKHHFVSANFNGPQLANDMKCLEPLILAICDRILNSQN